MRLSAIWILVVAAIAAVIIGCGGNNEGFRGSTPFTGAYAGTWNVPGGADIGFMTLTVADDATMVGSFTNVVTGESGFVRGGTHPEGGFNMTMTTSTGTVITVTGAMAITGSRNGLAGDGSFTRQGGAPQPFTFDLDRDQGESPFAGSFTAQYWIDADPATEPASGSMSMTITGGGAISGSFVDAGGTPRGRITGQVDVDGNFTIFFVENVTNVKRTVTGHMIIDTTTFDTAVWAGDGTMTLEDGTTHSFSFVSDHEENTTGTTSTATTSTSTTA